MSEKYIFMMCGNCYFWDKKEDGQTNAYCLELETKMKYNKYCPHYKEDVNDE